MRTPQEQSALERAIISDRLVDITTTGRKSGNQYRKEVRLRQIDGQVYLTNNPGTRDWAANLYAIPQLQYHFKESAQIDVIAVAIPIKHEYEKRQILTALLEKEGALDQLEARVAGSNLFQIDFTNEE